MNLDLRPTGGSHRIVAAAEQMPVADSSVDIVVSSDSLEHLDDPQRALREIRRVLRPDGKAVVFVPFLHPFHGDDLFRFTPEGLRLLYDKADLRIEKLDAPLWVCTVVAQIVVEVARRIGLKAVEHPLEVVAARLDHRLRRWQGAGLAFAAAYLVVAKRTTTR